MTASDEMEELAVRIYPVLRDWPSDARPDRIHPIEDITVLHAAGFIERIEQTKPCKCCGTPKFDYAYWRITGGGQLFVAAMERHNELVSVLIDDGKDAARRRAELIRAQRARQRDKEFAALRASHTGEGE